MNNKKGFTLIELMIVVAIIAILAMIAVPMYQRYIERSRNSATQSMLRQMAIALTALNVDTSNYLGTGVTTLSTTEINLLMTYGFRPDPNVGVAYAEVGESFILFASHKAKGSTAYTYDNQQGSGVMALYDLTHAVDPNNPKNAATGTLTAACPTSLNAFNIADGSSAQSRLSGAVTVAAQLSGGMNRVVTTGNTLVTT